MCAYKYLEKIDSPDDVKRLTLSEMSDLCTEMRSFLVESTSHTGGHLASNLGVVEISVAAHYVFDSPVDKIIFDVGHQSYVHKIITGRRTQMDTMRKYGGISGFLRPTESEHDAFTSGHASMSISAGLGMARANRVLKKPGRVVCIIGDGAMTGGMAYEALNDAGQSGEPLIIIYNDNEMSIDKNVGALTEKMSKLRIKPQYFKFKNRAKSVASHIPFGNGIINFLRKIKNFIKKGILKESIFEILGFEYLGPCDGNNIQTVIGMLNEAKNKNKPVVVHFKTQKGKGYAPSEDSPEKYHGVSSFSAETGELAPGGQNFSKVFGQYVLDVARKNPKVVAITAAMGAGTGLGKFANEMPDRFFDVGIAEEHAITMAGAMAHTGAVPVLAIYSTFLQRGYDQMLHDMAMSYGNIVLGIDRAGITGEDGETHQGVFDLPILFAVPGVRIYCPSSFLELTWALDISIGKSSGIFAVRYPRGTEREFKENTFMRDIAVLKQGTDITIVSYGIMINEAILAQKELEKVGISAEILKVNCLTGDYLDEIAKSVNRTKRLIVLEDSVQNGAFGQRVSSQLELLGMSLKFLRLMNAGETFVPSGKVDELYRHLGIDAKSVIDVARAEVQNG